MEKHEVLQHIASIGVLPVIRAEGQEEAVRVIDAVEAGGIPLLEITMTVPGALAVIEAVRRREKSAVVGAGTVLDPETARACILAGAQFIATPALDVATIAICRRYSVPVICGALTPTEVVAAWSSGADVVKVFPCSAVGGASYIKALKAPFPQISLMPSGGVSLKTAAEFIKAGAFALGVGSDLLDHNAIEEEDWNTLATAVSARAREYVGVVQEARS